MCVCVGLCDSTGLTNGMRVISVTIRVNCPQ